MHPMKDDKKGMEEYQADCDLRCLIEAEKVKRDPKRMKAAMALKAKKMKELKSLGSGGKTEG